MWESKPQALDRALLVLAVVAGDGLTPADMAALTGCKPSELDACLAEPWMAGLRRGTSRWTGNTIYALSDGKRRLEIMAWIGRAAAGCVEALHAWAEEYQGQGWPSTTPEYLLDGYFRLLESNGDVVRMIACATDTRRHERLRELTGGDDAALQEIEACQAAIAEQDVPDRAAASALAMAHERLTSRRFPASLPATLVAMGEPARAEQLASSIADPVQQARALHRLAIALIDYRHAEQARQTLARLVTAVSALDVPPVQYRFHPGPDIVAELADAGQWTSAERVARAISHGSLRAKALCGLVSALIADGHLDQAERVALSMDFSEVPRTLITAPAHQAMALVIGGLAAAGRFDHAESLARAFPTRDANKYYGGILALTELASALAAAGNDRFRELVRLTTPDYLQEDVMEDVCRAVAKTGDFERAEE